MARDHTGDADKAELEVFERQGFGRVLGLGKRPCLLVVDFVNGFVNPDLLGGGNIVQAVEQTAPLLAHCRKLGLPVAFSRIVFAEDGSDHNLWVEKVPSLKKLTESNPDSHVVDGLKMRDGELMIRKHHASAFLNTDFPSWLAVRQVDTVIVVGCTTSGCVRASVIDAMGWGYRPIVVPECTGDRALGPHNASLFDMEQKYADLIPRNDLMKKLEAL